MTKPFQVLTLSSIANRYPLVLLDAYGVFWGGNDFGLLPGAKEAMERLVLSGKTVGILSNATALVEAEIKKFHLHGIHQDKHFHFVVTSGEFLRHLLMTHTLPLPAPRKSYWAFGNGHPKYADFSAIFKDTPYTQVEHPQDADFGYISVPHKNGEDQTDPEVFRPALHEIHALKLPLICANPDLFAHAGMPPIAVVREGSIAKMYLEMGGKVHYIGKPHSPIYSFALERCRAFNITEAKDILMVGDTPETDIRGARSMGIDSALITQTGIMSDRIVFQGLKQTIDNILPDDLPTYFIPKLAE